MTTDIRDKWDQEHYESNLKENVRKTDPTDDEILSHILKNHIKNHECPRVLFKYAYLQMMRPNFTSISMREEDKIDELMQRIWKRLFSKTDPASMRNVF